MKSILTTARHIHFIGIGGIGISAVARMLMFEGKMVSGSDRDETKVTEELRKAGASVVIGHKAEYVSEDVDLVVYTNAVPKDNPEYREAERRGIPMLSYPETLDLISKEKFTIAISGTHGKTTTTAMVARILIDAGLDPTVIVGSLMKFSDGTESNFRAGKSKYLVVEADEYKKSFHNLHPRILVVNNIDEDHLDFYKDLADIQDSFGHLAERIPAEGFLICNVNDAHVFPILGRSRAPVLDYTSANIDVPLKLPGKHNIENAKAALTVAAALGVPVAAALKTLKEFEGVWRRFEYKGVTDQGVVVYDDYAHNPQKVRALLSAMREKFPDKRVTIVFQPHLYSRTKSLFDEFVKSFDSADEIVLVPIFPAREPFDASISSAMLAAAFARRGKKATSFDTFDAAEAYLRGHLSDDRHVLVTAGAGEAYRIGDNLLRGSH